MPAPIKKRLPGSVDGYDIDVTKSETHTMESEATQFPVEGGSKFTDNVLLNPLGLTIEGIISDTPIGIVAVSRKRVTAIDAISGALTPSIMSVGAAEPTYSEEAFARFEALWRSREPVTVTTSLKTYDNMVCVGFLPTATADQAHDGLYFTITFQQLELVTNDRTLIRVAVPIAAKKKNLGAVTPVINYHLLVDRLAHEWNSAFAERIADELADDFTQQHIDPVREYIKPVQDLEGTRSPAYKIGSALLLGPFGHAADLIP